MDFEGFKNLTSGLASLGLFLAFLAAGFYFVMEGIRTYKKSKELH